MCISVKQDTRYSRVKYNLIVIIVLEEGTNSLRTINENTKYIIIF